MKIKSIHIKYFRSIYNENIKLGGLNILAGLNDSGKSNVLKALNLFFNNETGWKEPLNFRSDFNHKRKEEFEVSRKARPKEAKEISIQINFEKYGEVVPVWKKAWRSDGVVYENRYDSNANKKSRNPNTGFLPYSKVPSMLNKISYYYVPALKGPEFISHLIGKLSNVLSERASNDIRDAARGFESKLGNHLSDITELIRDELALESLLRLPTNLIGIFENMEFSDDRGIGLSHRGDGMRTRHIPILLHKISNLHNVLKKGGELHDHFIWGYEEPENNVEMSACYEMAERFMNLYSCEHQIILTTHSPAFYGLPEREYEDWTQGELDTYRYQALINDGITNYAHVSQDTLDPYFLLPALSRHILKEIEEKKQLKDKLRDLENEGIQLNQPAIFVEGPSDKIVLEKALSIFYPDIEDEVIIYAPKSGTEGGGANYVKDHLISWELKQRHTPRSDRAKAIGVVDGDCAGNDAKSQFQDFVGNSESAYCRSYKYSYSINDHFTKLKESDMEYHLEHDMENMYAISFWDIAEEKGWLEARSGYHKNISASMQVELLQSNKCIDDVPMDKGLKRYCTHKFSSSYKVAAAKFILESDKSDAKNYLYLFDKYLGSTLKKIGLDTNS